MKVEKGYTMTEILIVVVVLGMLAVMIIPRYTGQSERGLVAEAVAMLGNIRQAEVAYQLENAAFTTNLASLDIDTSTSTKFTFTVSTAGAATAVRTPGGGTTFNSKTIILDIAGTWSGDHPFRPI
ncbi:MAG: type IV pilin-like G/H family protein [Candidatus Omnitrophota bacterium]